MRLVATLMLLIAGCLCLQAAPRRVVKVGVFPHAPALFMAEDGTAKGFYADMLHEVAVREGWDLRFVPGTWQEGLDRAKTGEVDLITSVALTAERETYLDYCKAPAFTVWSILYAHPGSGILTVLDVQDRRVALMRGDVNGQHFRELCEKFNIPATFVEVGSFVDVMRSVESGQAEAGVATNIFGYAQEGSFKVERTPVVFSPFDTFFATGKQRNADLLTALDAYLLEGRRNPDSDYHRAINQWLSPQVRGGLPPWVLRVGLGTLAALVVAVLLALAFRRQVDRATARIQVLNAGLQRELAEKQRLEDQILHVASGVSTSFGDTFFQNLVRHLAQASGADAAFLGEAVLDQGVRRVKTLAVFLDGTPVDNLAYDVAGSPCEQALKGDVCVIPSGVQERFPAMGMLCQLQAQGYVGAPLIDSHQKVQGFLAVVHRSPLSAPKEAASLLSIFASRAAGELERRHSEEDRDLLERQMQHAQKLESLGVLAGGIAHDFNNLLTAMLGHMNMAQTKLPQESSALPHLESLERIIHRAADLTRQMLAYSGRGRFVVRPYDLNKVVHEVTHLLEVSIPKKISLRFDLAPGLPAVEADAAQIQQVIMNLVTNASDAIGDQDGTIRLSTSTLNLDRTYLDQVFQGQNLEPGTYVSLEVSDSGCGMPREVLDRIFEPFFTTKVTGRGLGLSATIGILKGHRAGLRIYSEVGRGTTFKLLFRSTEACEAPAPTQALVPAQACNATLLLVDDEEIILESATAMIEALGLKVITATNGREALEIVRRTDLKVDLILMDLTMPHMDGREAFQAIRRIHPQMPVILSSGYNEQESIQAFTGRGLAAFLQKPYSLQALQRTVLEVLALATP
jgi:signal transduction histidine kinase/ABC-type amino acid transport substrate-binding protein